MSRPRRSFYLLLPLVSILLTLLLAEWAFSVFYPVPFSLEKNMYYEPDPYTGFRHKPGSAGKYLNGVAALANSRGQRDDEVAIPKPAGVYRILMVGDSFTAGASVEQSAAYPQVLERLLNAESGQTVEIVNTGTGGWAPFQYAQYVEHYGAEFEPDMLLLGFFVGNDSYIDRFQLEDTLTTMLGRRVSRQTGASRWGAATVYLYEHSHIARLLLTQSFDAIKFERADCRDFADYFLGVQKTRLKNHVAQPAPEQLALLQKNVAQIARVQQWADQRGIPLVVFVFPDENQINPALQALVIPADQADKYDLANPQALLKPLFILNGITAVDLQAPIAADTRCLFMNDSHWTAAGHALVAGAMRDYLRSSGLLPD